MPLNTTKCVLLICICSVVFHRCEGQETNVRDTGIGLNTLRRKAVLLYNSAERFKQQRILPSMSFSCSGTISKWTFVARIRTGRKRDQYPLFQLWKPSRTGRYQRVYESSSDGGNFTMSDVSGITTGEYLPHDPVPFQTNYILGVYQPGSGSNSRLSLIHVNVPGVFGRENYVRQNETSLSVFNIFGAVVENDEPLVAVNTTSPQCVQGLLIEEAVRIAADVYATRLSVRTRERQQCIIPGIKFTCTGTLTKWILGARRTPTQATSYLQLQIWRRQGSSDTYDRTTFSDITALNATDDLNAYEYIPNPPLQFQTNDTLGLYQPRIRDTQVALYYQTGSGPQTFRLSNQDSPLVNTSASGQSDTDLPLVAVEVNGGSAENCTEGFVTREGLADEAFFIPNFMFMYGRQLIIPNITFTRSGSVVRWTFAARYRASATQYPELQVWRENTTGRYVKVASTGNMEPAETAYLNVYEYVLDPPLQVLAGDVLGIYQPSFSNSRVQLLFLSDSNLVNWFTTGTIPQDSFVVTGSLTNNVLPLLVVSFETEVPTTSVGIVASTPLPNPGTTIPSGSTTGLIAPTMLPNSDTLPPVISLPTPSSDASPVSGSPVGAIAGALVGVMVVVVGALAVVLLVVLVLRKRQRKSSHKVDTQERTVDNPVYAGDAVYHYAEVESTQSIYHNCHTLEPDSAYQENPLQYEVPVPQQHIVHKNNEGYATCYNWGLYVPTEGDRKAFKTTVAESIYATLSESQYSSVGPDPTFFEESATYWSPASDSEGLYQQLADKKYREILRHQIQITEHLGSGQFGTVNKGMWQSPAGAVEVAVKTLQSSASQGDRVTFLQEAAINGQFKHPNVVKLLGVVTVGEPVMIVLELLTNGDLRNYLIKQRPVPGEMVPSDTSHTLLVFCKDIASGMQCLAGKSFVHRDLAARNILVAGDKTCKIADFGMSRDLMDENYYVSHGGQIPVKWTAPEALHFKKYSTASDVWSYGAVMYEIWSLGHKPFEEYSNPQAMKLVERGYRLPPPPGCPKALYKLMTQCWNADKSSRPDFAELVHALSSPVTDLLSWSEEDMRVHPQAAVLGAPLEAGKDLYPELQGTYMHN